MRIVLLKGENMKAVKFLVMVAALLLVLSACGNNKALEDGKKEYRPDWWEKQDDPNYVFTYGIATGQSETSTIDFAQSNALDDAARYVEVEIKNILEGFEKQVGPELYKSIENVTRASANATFSGVLVGQSETWSNMEKGIKVYKTFMQMKIPKVEISRELIENIRREEALYNEFKADQGFLKLDEQFQD